MHQKRAQQVLLVPRAALVEPLARILEVAGHVVDMDEHAGREHGQDIEIEPVHVAPDLAHVRRVDEQDVARAECGERLQRHFLHAPLDERDPAGVTFPQQRPQPAHVGIDEGELHRAAEHAVVQVEHRRGTETGTDLDDPPRPRLAQHRVEHDRVEMTVGGVREMETPAGRRLLGKRLLRVPAGEAFQPLQLPRLVKIDPGKRRTEPAAREGLRRLLARRQRRVEMPGREKPRPVRLRRTQLPELAPQPLVFPRRPPVRRQQPEEGLEKGTHQRKAADASVSGPERNPARTPPAPASRCAHHQKHQNHETDPSGPQNDQSGSTEPSDLPCSTRKACFRQD
ncbi:MAG: hypothetical protein RLZZ221_235 [Verrucomicrobiota bacterium]